MIHLFSHLFIITGGQGKNGVMNKNHEIQLKKLVFVDNVLPSIASKKLGIPQTTACRKIREWKKVIQNGFLVESVPFKCLQKIRNLGPKITANCRVKREEEEKILEKEFAELRGRINCKKRQIQDDIKEIEHLDKKIKVAEQEIQEFRNLLRTQFPGEGEIISNWTMLL